MIYQYTSCKRVIAKVFADLDLQEGSHRIADMVEWISEALEKIGAFPQFIIKTTGRDGEPLLPVSNFQARLPMGLHNIIQVAYAEHEDGPFFAMRYGSGSFDYNKVGVDLPSAPTTSAATSQIITTIMSLYQNVYEEKISDPTFLALYPTLYSYAVFLYNTDKSVSDQVRGMTTGTSDYAINLATQSGIVKNSGYTYVIQGGYIKCNKEVGYLMMSYQSIPLDIDGLPLVPEDAAFQEAIYWYIVKKLYYPEWKNGSLRDAVYYDAKRSWNYYRNQAYGNALMPNSDQMESIKNTWLRLVPQVDAHANFYATLNEKEQIYKL